MSQSTVGPDAVAVGVGIGVSATGTLMAFSSLMGIVPLVLGAEVAAIGGSVAAELPSGAAALVLATDVALIAVSICNPVDFWHEAEKWASVSDFCSAWEQGLVPTMAAFQEAWEGDSCEAFMNFFNSKMSPVVGQLKSLADAEWALLVTVIGTIVAAIIAVLIPTLALMAIAIGLLASAAASFGATLAAQWPATGSWAAVIATAVTGAVATMVANLKLAHDIEVKAKELSYAVNGASGDLANNRLQAPDLALPTIGTDITQLEQMTGKFTPK